ncbi:MAG: hypothetical protein KC414_08025 [Romboutsia sp.]|nr:hypothetical protein [Romboutsia sp.]
MDNKESIYLKVLEQLNETFNPENFDEEHLTNEMFNTEDVKTLQQPNFTYRRYLYRGNRLYVKLPLTWEKGKYPVVGNKILAWGFSLTSVISWTEPNRGFNALENWKTSMRLKGINPDEYASERADFGSVMHYLFSVYLKGTEFVKKTFKEDIVKALVKDGVLRETRAKYILDNYNRNLWNALIGFGRFVIDYNVRPIASELIVQDSKNWIATPVDLLCYMDVPVKIKVEVPTGEIYQRGEKKGESKTKEKTYVVPKSLIGIVDFKSGSKGFYNSHYFQLNWGKDMLEETYGIKAEILLNYAPKDDMSTSYKVKEQMGSDNLDMFLPVMKEMSNLHLQDMFKDGIKLSYDDSGDSDTINIKNFKKKEDEEVNYVINGDEVIDNEFNYKFNYKNELNGTEKED